MNIKNVNDKPMVIHTKKKMNFHMKGAPKAKIKSGNNLVLERNPKMAGNTGTGKVAKKINHTVSIIKVKTSGKGINAKAIQEKGVFHGDIRKSIPKENASYAQTDKFDSYRKLKQNREKSAGKKNDMVDSRASVETKMALEHMESGTEVYESYMKVKRIKKVQADKKIGKKAVKSSTAKVAKGTTKATKKEAKETPKTTSKTTTVAAGTAEETVVTRRGRVPSGAAARETVGREQGRRDKNNSARNRMIQLFVSKLRQEESQDSIGKTLKSIVMMRFSVMVKHIVRYVGLFLLGMFALVALVALPIIILIAIIYNSPLAIFFPSVSSAETTQQVLSAYAAEFHADVDSELEHTAGYDKSQKVYVNFTGQGIPDNYCDILAVYMVKHGNGDTATDMTDKAKQNLKRVFNDMCSYSLTNGTETKIDEQGNIISYTVKYVNVTLKTYQDMIPVYGFNTEEQEMLAELMKPENLAMFGYDGPDGGEEIISAEQYQAIVDAVSDANGKKIVEFALSKVGYPYSQALRNSGTHFDCSSLAYYAWNHVGVNIMYEGSNTASAEGKYCYDNKLLVEYGEMQPGDLIFYSYEKNGRFMDISHVAIYAGDGKVVEAANARIGVVYRPIQGKNSIVMIGRPRQEAEWERKTGRTGRLTLSGNMHTGSI